MSCESIRRLITERGVGTFGRRVLEEEPTCWPSVDFGIKVRPEARRALEGGFLSRRDADGAVEGRCTRWPPSKTAGQTVYRESDLWLLRCAPAEELRLWKRVRPEFARKKRFSNSRLGGGRFKAGQSYRL